MSISFTLIIFLQADVICRQLGYSRSIGHYSNSYFGSVSGTHSYSNVNCYGYETRLEDCSHEDYTGFCGGNDGAGVYCEVESYETSTFNPVTTTTTWPWYTTTWYSEGHSYISCEYFIPIKMTIIISLQVCCKNTLLPMH